VRLGATRFLPQPVDTGRLVAILKGVTRQTPPQPFRVVIVEDDVFLGEVYREGLSDAGIEVCVIGNPLLAPAEIRRFEPDVIVSDLFMPGCNGFELLSLLRQDDGLADTPILILSSEPDVGRHMEALALGADDFLTKPVDMELLIAAVTARARRARQLKRSRSEYRRLLQRMHEMEPYLPESFPGQTEAGVDFDDFFTETINMDDYVVREVGRDELEPPKSSA
jgi:PleD family two-component response regulator